VGRDALRRVVQLDGVRGRCAACHLAIRMGFRPARWSAVCHECRLRWTG
jgi:hypothetical protein